MSRGSSLLLFVLVQNEMLFLFRLKAGCKYDAIPWRDRTFRISFGPSFRLHLQKLPCLGPSLHFTKLDWSAFTTGWKYRSLGNWTLKQKELLARLRNSILVQDNSNRIYCCITRIVDTRQLLWNQFPTILLGLEDGILSILRKLSWVRSAVQNALKYELCFKISFRKKQILQRIWLRT